MMKRFGWGLTLGLLMGFPFPMAAQSDVQPPPPPGTVAPARSPGPAAAPASAAPAVAAPAAPAPVPAAPAPAPAAPTPVPAATEPEAPPLPTIVDIIPIPEAGLQIEVPADCHYEQKGLERSIWNGDRGIHLTVSTTLAKSADQFFKTMAPKLLSQQLGKYQTDNQRTSETVNGLTHTYIAGTTTTFLGTQAAWDLTLILGGKKALVVMTYGDLEGTEDLLSAFFGSVRPLQPHLPAPKVRKPRAWTATPVTSAIFNFTRVGSTIYATAQTGLYRTTDAGLTWTNLTAAIITGQSASIRTMAAEGSRLFAGDFLGNIYRSDDGGTGWQKVGVQEGLTRLALSAGTLLAGTDDRGLFKSTDGGLSWTSISAGLPTSAIRGAPHLATIQTIACVGNALMLSTGSGIYGSNDGGATWKQVDAEGAKDIFLSNTPPSYLVRHSDVYRWADPKLGWEPIYAIQRLTNWFEAAAIDGDTLYVSTHQGTLYRLSPAGAERIPTTQSAGPKGSLGALAAINGTLLGASSNGIMRMAP